jgi:ankyrin repeat protein
MRTITTVLMILMVFSFVSCGNQDESSKQTAESDTSVSAPEMDLHAAVFMDNLDAIRQHIKAGSDLNVLEPSRASTPLITAAALGRTEAAMILIGAGAALNYRTAMDRLLFIPRRSSVARRSSKPCWKRVLIS